MMKITPHSIVNNPETIEINAKNWYQTEMFDQPPTIMAFVGNPQHPIFCYKWNAQNWLDKFNETVSTDRNLSNSLKLHLLRMTVMLNTIGTIRKKGYTIDDKVVTLDFKRLQTVIYDHTSQLSQEKRILAKELKSGSARRPPNIDLTGV
jgi:hypothetical protein